MKTIETDILVIGAGPAGYTAAFRCADMNKKVILLNKYNDLGGVCLNVGCIPSKTLLHIAKNINSIKKSQVLGIKSNFLGIDKNIILKYKNNIIKRLNYGLLSLAKARNISVITGIGKFISPYEVYIEELNKKIKFQYCIIATGSKNNTIRNIPKDNRIITSSEALNLNNISGKLLIIGGGIIGLEMAEIYSSLGKDISIVEFNKQLISNADNDLITPLYNKIRKKYDIFLNSIVKNMQFEKNYISVEIYNNDTKKLTKKTFDEILVAIGRSPQSDNLSLQNAGIYKDKNNFITSDKYLRTNIQHIYSIGDVRSNPMLAHKATFEAHIASNNICNKKYYFIQKCIPSVAYTSPEVAWVGLTEKIAQKKNIEYDISIFPWKK